MERLCWHQALRYDGRVVSKQRFFRRGIHIFWVAEGNFDVRYEVETRGSWRPQIVAVRRNGRLLGG